jgi:hypothetical protein
MLEKTHKEGNRIRKEYVVYGQSSKKRLQEQLDKLLAVSSSVNQAAADSKGMFLGEGSAYFVLIRVILRQ